MKVLAVLEALPGTGKVKARRLMEHVGISETRRLQGLGAKQRESLLEAVEPGPDPRLSAAPAGSAKARSSAAWSLRDGRLWLVALLDDPCPPSRRAGGRVHLRRQGHASGRVAAGGFLEWATVLGEYYGTPTPETLRRVTTSSSRSTSRVPVRCSSAARMLCVLLVRALAGRPGSSACERGATARSTSGAGWRSGKRRRRRAASWRPTSSSTTISMER